MTQDELVAELRRKVTGRVTSAAYVDRPLITLVIPGRRRPFPAKGFPRAELLCYNSAGGSVWLYDAERLLRAIEKHHPHVVPTGVGKTAPQGVIDLLGNH